MTHTQKRKIYVDSIEYEWSIRGNDLWVTSARHITIYKSGIKGRPLYLDPYPWALEIRPETIKKAIEFANKNGWIPENKGVAKEKNFKDAETVLYELDAAGNQN